MLNMFLKTFMLNLFQVPLPSLVTRLEGLIHEANSKAREEGARDGGRDGSRDGGRDGARRSVGPLERGGLGWVAGVLRQIPVPVVDIFRAYTKVIGFYYIL